jgi:hypothetical protein
VVALSPAASQIRHASRLVLIESQPRSLLRAAVRELTGVTAVSAIVLGTLGAEAWRPRSDGLLPDQSIARWLAPINRRPTPAPREERIQFLGLGGVQPIAAITRPEAQGDERQATPVESNQPSGTLLVSQDASTADEFKAYTEVEVDSTAILDPESVAPVFPPELLKQRIEGVVMARFVVDSAGHVDLNSFELLANADKAFVDAVRDALPKMRYRPAVYAGKRVNQLAEQRFSFRIAPPTDHAATTGR